MKKIQIFLTLAFVIFLTFTSCKKVKKVNQVEEREKEAPISSIEMDKSVLEYAQRISQGQNCHIAIQFQPKEQVGTCRVLMPDSHARFTLVITDLEQATNNMATGKQKSIASSTNNGPYGIPMVVIPMVKNDTIARAVFLHELFHTTQLSGLSEAQSELEAYMVERNYIKQVFGKRYDEFMKKAIPLYKEKGIATDLFQLTNELFPGTSELEKNIIRPVFVLFTAIEAGNTTEKTFQQVLNELNAFFSSVGNVPYKR